jgi:AAA+ ATPase superfamily predicted ATPase
LVVVYGRRRCGKSRLLQQALPSGRAVYFVGDDREAPLQRASLAAQIGRRLAGFDRVSYPDWEAILDRFWAEAPPGTVLAIDELPALVSASRELPSLLQKRLDSRPRRCVHLILAGSSQRMMQGLALDRAAPLFGRAQEILKIGPLPAGWIRRALKIGDPAAAVEAFSVWGGIPRYWELAADHRGLDDALRALVLSPRGVLHEEPSGLLLDDLRDTTQAASILSLIGQGAHRLSEIAARLEKPATSLARPLRRLVELDLVRRDTPFGVSPKDSKRALYEIADPFLRFWFRFVEPNRSRLEAGQVSDVAAEVRRRSPQHTAEIWEELARLSVPRLLLRGRSWRPASRWWGPGLDRKPMEIDVVAESTDGRSLLLGEARWSEEISDRLLSELAGKAERFPVTRGRDVVLALWLKKERRRAGSPAVLTPARVLRALR